MTSERLKALTDGVIAIVITIMVLELKAPGDDTPAALLGLLPALLSYVLSFGFIAIYWTNHHHFFVLTPRVNGAVLWANLNLLFWISLVPVATSWIGEHQLRPWPTAVYGATLLACSAAWHGLQAAIIHSQGPDSPLRRALGPDFKGKLSIAGYALGIAGAFVHPVAAAMTYAATAALWLIPDRRVDRAVHMFGPEPHLEPGPSSGDRGS